MAKSNSNKQQNSKSSSKSASKEVSRPVVKTAASSQNKTIKEAPSVAAKVMPSSPAPKAAAPVLTGEALTNAIKAKAQEIWEKKGRQAGKDLENWLEAERIVKGKN